MKKMISVTTMQFSLGFKSIREKGIASFKDIAKHGHTAFRALIGGMTKMFLGLFAIIGLGFIGAIGAFVTAATRRS